MDKIQEYHHLINELIESQSALIGTHEPKELYLPISYVMLQKGKRLRPLLTLLACDLFGGNIKNAMFPALAIEVFHNFTLVHDDIMDKAPIRRGMETVYKKWNADTAILSGDTMFALAYQYALKTEASLLPEILGVFNKAAIEVCEGQQLDINFENRHDVNIEDYLHMIRLKTAVLLGASLQIGGLIAHAPNDAIQNIYEFGSNLGIAFQLQDDLLDVFGNEKEFGKKRGGDIAANKKTYLYIKSLELANPQQLKLLQQLYSDNDANQEDKIDQVIHIFNALNIKKIVSDVMHQYFTQSMRFFEAIQVEESKKSDLYLLAHQLYNRNH